MCLEFFNRFRSGTFWPLPLPGRRRPREGSPALAPLVLAPAHHKSARSHVPRCQRDRRAIPQPAKTWQPRGHGKGSWTNRCPNPTTSTLKGKSLSLPVVSPVFSITITFNYFSSKVYNVFFPLLCRRFSVCPSGKGHWASTFLLCNEL